jgi:hypothetical protein
MPVPAVLVTLQSVPGGKIWELAKAGNPLDLTEALLGTTEADLAFEQVCGVRTLCG